ncbi:MAG: MATE family efflux transporter [Nitratireductor sp.]
MIFVVDLANLFISLLGQQELAAAVGAAARRSCSFGLALHRLAIAATAIIAVALGAKNYEAAHARMRHRLLIIMAALHNAQALLMYGPALGLDAELPRPAKGETAAIALGFMRPGSIHSADGYGDLPFQLVAGLQPRGAWCRDTLSAGMSAAVLDPLLIFGLDLKVTGAAIAIVLVRIIMVSVGFHAVWKVHKMLAKPDMGRLVQTFLPLHGYRIACHADDRDVRRQCLSPVPSRIWG